MSQSPNKQVALITGANRGLGLEFTRQALEKGFSVIGCCRNPDKADKLKELQSKNKDTLSIEKLDTNDDTQIEELAKKLKDKAIDLLILNAGIMGTYNPFGKLTRKDFSTVINTNTTSTILLAQALYENVKKSTRKQILAVSSSLGSISDMLYYAANQVIPYRVSKTGVNMITNCIAQTSITNKDGIIIQAVCPGWVQTDLGGDKAPLKPQESISNVWKNVIEQYQKLKNGGYYLYDGKVIPY